MKYFIFNLLEKLFDKIENKAGKARELFSICQYCGKNRYSGKPCKNN